MAARARRRASSRLDWSERGISFYQRAANCYPVGASTAVTDHARTRPKEINEARSEFIGDAHYSGLCSSPGVVGTDRHRPVATGSPQTERERGPLRLTEDDRGRRRAGRNHATRRRGQLLIRGESESRREREGTRRKSRSWPEEASYRLDHGRRAPRTARLTIR